MKLDLARSLRERVGIALRNPKAVKEFLLYNKLYNVYMERPGAVFEPRLMDSRIRQALVKDMLLPFPLGGKTLLARMANVRVLRGSRLSGSVRVPSPTRVQINTNCRARNFQVKDGAYVLVDNGSTVRDVSADQDTIFSRIGVQAARRLENPGTFMCVDFEGSVGFEHGKVPYRIPGFDSRRSALQLVDLLEKWEIPCTWFVCGHLFLDGCDGKHPYNEVDWDGVDWFRYDPATTSERNDSWYLPDIIERLVDSDLFEVGYHSFAHMLFIKMSDESIRRDMEFARRIRKEWNIPFDSLAFTCNEPSRFELLVEGGFRRYRGLIGCAPASGILSFPGFSFLQSSRFLSPRTSLDAMDGAASSPSSSIFTHAHDWVSESDFAHFRVLLSHLKERRDSGLPLLRASDMPVAT